VTRGGDEGDSDSGWRWRVQERREDGDGRSGSTVVKGVVDSESYPKGGKRSDARNILFKILFCLGSPVNYPKSRTSGENLEPLRCLY
jgi:hypothetical protein